MSPLPRSRADVLAARRASGLTIAAVVPARDEAATVGAVVGGLAELVAADLLTEVVVVSDSSDRTDALAMAAGARVLRQERHVEPGANGKGVALWQGVRETTADVVLFVDADVRGFEADFVVPLLAPLLCQPEVQLAKASYRRPFTDTGDPLGGGRVTTLLARPLLSVLWPELGFLEQPLAGEYAGRRELFESLPFVAGYGVEIGLVLDTFERHGADAITEVFLGVREHTHQELDALAVMATEILAVALDRAARQGRTPAEAPIVRGNIQGDCGIVHTTREVRVRQRPPLAG